MECQWSERGKNFRELSLHFRKEEFWDYCLIIQGHIYWGRSGGPAPPPSSPIIFLIFVLQNVTKLVLHFTFVAISSAQLTNHGRFMSCHLTAQFCFHFGFELKNNYVVINI